MEGRSVAELAQAAGADPFQTALDIIAREQGAVSIIAGSMNEDIVGRFMALPWTVVGSDGSPNEGKPHPRVYGTFPRVIRRFVREQRVLGLAEAVRKMTGQTASRLRLTDFGQVAPGFRAEAVLFDPETFADTATFADPCRHPLGVAAVISAGRPVLLDGAATGERPGRFIPAGGN